MKFNVMAIKLFQYYVKNNQIDPNSVKVVASTSTDNTIDEVPENNKLVLNYDDNATSFNDSIANQIKSFISDCSSSDNIYIMCDAGESRSTAIAAALNRYYNGNDDSIWNNAKYHPNPYVYKTMCKALGINIEDEEVNDKVNTNNKALKDTINKSRLNEKASIDWNNYLTPVEVKKFLAKDDKVESAEEIVYNTKGNFYNKYFKDLKKKGWTKRELTQDLANFYEAGHLEELKEAVVDKKTFGNKAPNINKFMNLIPNVFKELEKYGINMALDPITQRPNTATFVGNDFDNNRIMIDFNTNHRDLEKEDGNQVFSNVFFGMKGTKAGSYNLNNASETAEQLKNSLEEIGFRTAEEKKNDEDESKRAQDEEKQAKEEEIKKAREKRQRDRETIEYNKNLDKEEPEEVEPDVEPEENFSEVLNDSVAELAKRNEINSSIHIKYEGKEDEFSIDCFYISSNKYLVKSDDIALDNVMTTDNMVKYLNDLTNNYKVTACNTYTAPGEKTPEKGLSLHIFM